MKLTFATYEHSPLGFPKIKLKWSVNGLSIENGYVTIADSIKGDWNWERGHCGSVCYDSNLKRFDDWVRLVYSNDPSVQG